MLRDRWYSDMVQQAAITAHVFTNGDRPDELFSTDKSAADTRFPNIMGCILLYGLWHPLVVRVEHKYEYNS